MGPNMGGPNMPMGGHMGHMQPMGGPGPGMPQGGPPNMQNQMGPGGPMGMGPGGPGQIPMSQHQQMGGPMGPMCGSGPQMRGGPPPQMVYGNHQPPQRMGGQGVRGSPYRMPPNNPSGSRAFPGANIQVKPNAPNTIQYLPARPPNNQGSMCPQPGMGGPGGPPPRGLDFLQRYTNPSPGPVVNVNMGINVSVMPGNRMGYPGPPGQGMPGQNSGPPCGPMRVPHPMMDQGPQAQQQQLPPNMMGGGGAGMKGAGGYPPPGGGPHAPQPNDPAYAQQFHHFQQQLYATGSNNGRNPNMPPNIGQNNPPPQGNQAFFK